MTHLLYPHSSFFKPAKTLSQMTVEATRSGDAQPSRIGTIAETTRGAEVEILEYDGRRKPKILASFSAHTTDCAVAMVHDHDSMRGFDLKNVY